MLKVVDTSAWPSISEITLIATPFDSSRVAAECLRSCIRVPAGRPPRSSNGFHERLWRLWTLMGDPACELKTHSDVCRSVAIVLCCRNAAMASLESRIVRRPLAVFGGLTFPSNTVRLICNVLASKSMSRHWIANGSPLRIPVVQASTHNAYSSSFRAVSSSDLSCCWVSGVISRFGGLGGVTVSATLRGTSDHLTACLSALCKVTWMISTERGDKPAFSFWLYTFWTCRALSLSSFTPPIIGLRWSLTTSSWRCQVRCLTEPSSALSHLSR